MSVAPGGGEQWAQAADPQRPGTELVHRFANLRRGENAAQVPSAQDGAYLDVEDVRSPWNGVDRQQATECSATDGVDDEFDARRGVDDDRDHTSPAARASASVSAAVTPSRSGYRPEAGLATR